MNLALGEKSLWPGDTAEPPREVQENPSASLPAARSDSSPTPRPAETQQSSTRVKRRDLGDQSVARNTVTLRS